MTKARSPRGAKTSRSTTPLTRTLSATFKWYFVRRWVFVPLAALALIAATLVALPYLPSLETAHPTAAPRPAPTETTTNSPGAAVEEPPTPPTTTPPTTAPEAQETPAPEPPPEKTQPAPEPTREAEPEPQPTKKQRQEPKPKPAPTKKPAPKPQPAPKPEPKPEPEPKPAPTKKPAPKPQPAPKPPAPKTQTASLNVTCSGPATVIFTSNGHINVTGAANTSGDKRVSVNGSGTFPARAAEVGSVSINWSSSGAACSQG